MTDNLFYHEKDFGVPAEWNFFAASHGKGPSDWLGGTLKRLATRASLQGVLIQTPKQLYDWALTNFKFSIKFVSAEECCSEKDILRNRFESAVSIPGIRSMHTAIPTNNDGIEMKTVSSSATGSTYKTLLKKCIKRKSKTMKK